MQIRVPAIHEIAGTCFSTRKLQQFIGQTSENCSVDDDEYVGTEDSHRADDGLRPT